MSEEVKYQELETVTPEASPEVLDEPESPTDWYPEESRLDVLKKNTRRFFMSKEDRALDVFCETGIIDEGDIK